MKKFSFCCIVLISCLLFSSYGCTKSKKSKQVESGSVVEPVVAGMFYPANKDQLKKVVEKYINEATSADIKGHILGLAVPHAGYQYSGMVAGSGFRLVKGKPYKTVVVLAPSHRVSFEGIALTTKDFYETPLGKIPIAKDLSQKLISKYDWAHDNMRPFMVEHSLEVELPFLQVALKDFNLLPIIMGTDGINNLEKIAKALNELKPGDDVLFVASTDLSHYYSYDVAKAKDRKTIKMIEEMNALKLAKDVKEGKAEMCGSAPVCTLVALAKMRGAEAKLIKYANSGDTAGDKSRVVGYAAIAFVTAGGDKSEKYSSAQKTALLKIARAAIKAEVLGKKQPSIKVDDPLLQENGAAFVTITEKGRLRGCIGHIFAFEPLVSSIRNNAIAAVSRDPRFPPVSPKELKDIHIEISVLTPPEPLPNPLDVKVGTDGLIIKKGFHRGVLLPQVPVELGWTKKQYLDGICRKAGLPPGAWKDAKLEKFQAIIFHE